jgi:hypothetical protein
MRDAARSFTILVLLGFACVVAACATRSVTIDRGFLAPVVNLPLDRELSTSEDARVAESVWNNEEELRYLIRRRDPLAVRAGVRLVALGYIPGGCACTNDAFDADICAHGATPEFWAELRSLSPEHQVTVLRAIDGHPYSENDSDSSTSWFDDRDRYLAGAPQVASLYGAIHADAE